MKKNRANAIRRNLILTFLLVLLLPSVTIGIVTYQNAKYTVDEEIQRSALRSVETTNEIINDTLQSKLHDLDYFTEKLKTADIHTELAQQGTTTVQSLREYWKLHPDTMEIFVGTEEGQFIKSTEDPLPEGYDPREREWYQRAMDASGEPIISTPYTSSGGAFIVVTVAKMVPDGKSVVGIDLNLESIRDLVQMKVGEEGYTFVLDQDGKYLFHPEHEAGTEASAQAEWISKLYEQPTGEISYLEGVDKRLHYITNEHTGWIIAGSMSLKEVDESVSGIRNTMILVLIVSLLAALLLVARNVQSVIKPLRHLRDATEVISEGDLTYHLKGFKRDEVGELASNFQQMVDSLREMVHGVQTMTENVSASSEQLSASAQQNTTVVEHVTSSIQEVAAGNEHQLFAAEEILKHIHQVSQRADDIAEILVQVAGAMDQTEELAQNGNHSVISSAVTMQDMDQAMNDLNGVIQQLSKRTEEIGGIAAAITDIAKQTSLLSLNASIEAARAGEQGKGFAVVAVEIRNLAQRSETSAEYITGLITNILADVGQTIKVMDSAKAKVEDGVDAADVTGRSFSRIMKAIRTVSGQVKTTSEAAKELAQETTAARVSIEEIRRISEQTSSQTQTISAASEEQLASMEEVTASAADLSQLAEELQDMVKRFKV